MKRDLNISDINGAKKNIPDLEVFGNGDTFKLLCKASSKEQGFMKSTKVCNLWGGCLVQVSTMQKNIDRTYSLSEALTYVPGNHIVCKDGENPEFDICVSIDEANEC